MFTLRAATLLRIGCVECNPGPGPDEGIPDKVGLDQGNPAAEGRNQPLMYLSIRERSCVFLSVHAIISLFCTWLVLIFKFSMPQVAQIRKSWKEACQAINPRLLDVLAREDVTLAAWRGLPPGERLSTLETLANTYEGKWLVGWTTFLMRVASK